MIRRPRASRAVSPITFRRRIRLTDVAGWEVELGPGGTIGLRPERRPRGVVEIEQSRRDEWLPVEVVRAAHADIGDKVVAGRAVDPGRLERERVPRRQLQSDRAQVTGIDRHVEHAVGSQEAEIHEVACADVDEVRDRSAQRRSIIGRGLG